MRIRFASDLIAAMTHRSGRTVSPPFRDVDRDRVIQVLFPEHVWPSIRKPDGNTIVEGLSCALQYPEFGLSIANAFQGESDTGHSGKIDPETIGWLRDAFPIEATTKIALANTTSRNDVLFLLLRDRKFLSAVEPTSGRRGMSADPEWPAPSPDVISKLQMLVACGSALLDPKVLAQWGASVSMDVQDLYSLGYVSVFKSNHIFDRDFYRKSYNTNHNNYFLDLLDYIFDGEKKDRSPNPFLNMASLRNACHEAVAEIASGSVSCLLDYLVQSEVRDNLIAASHFDVKYYSSQLSAKQRVEYDWLYVHYINKGWQEGLEPNPCFDQLWYLRSYPDAFDVLDSSELPNAFSHFLVIGESRGYRPCAFFDSTKYKKSNKDIESADFISPFQHFWQYGRFEHRAFGIPETSTVARYFYRRLPTSLDVLGRSGLYRLSGKPKDVLALSQEPVEVGDAVQLILSTSHQEGGSVRGNKLALSPLLEALGRPVVHIEAGRGQHLFKGESARWYISGLASLGSIPLSNVRVLSTALKGNCEFHLYPRLDEIEAAALFADGEKLTNTGFMAWFEVSAANLSVGEHSVDVQFQFRLDDTSPPVLWHETLHLAVLERPEVSTSTASRQVAMATYNPPDRPLKRQLDTILENPGVHVLISDDASPARGTLALAKHADRPQVTIDYGKRNLHFVLNFERSLLMRSPKAATLLFADQDDAWYPYKVATLESCLTPGVSCAFSDMRIVKKDGEVISETFWQGRTVHFNDPVTLSVANTVTGAASAFPVELIDFLLPFPNYMGVYHDQWLAVIAAAVGRVAYHPAPLYDYIQHGSNVLGFSGSRAGNERHWKIIARALRRALKRGRADPRDLTYVEMSLGSTIPLLQRFVLLNEALRRAPVWQDHRVREFAKTVLDMASGIEIDEKQAYRFWLRLKRQAGGDAALLNIDDMFIAIFTSRVLIDKGVVSVRALIDLRHANQRAWDIQIDRDTDPRFGLLERKTQPLKLAHLQDEAPETLRVTIFLPELQLGTFFGGYHSKISLISRLVERGVQTRIVLLDQPTVDYAGIARIMSAFPELAAGLTKSQIEAHGSRSGSLNVGNGDVLVATTWWSAHVVNNLRQQLGRSRFLYFIQEYEPFTFELGTNYRAAELTYDFPHDAIFSTDFLEAYFRHSAFGVFGPHAARGAHAMAFRNPITGLKGVERRPLGNRSPRLLFYARPQSHASRNMYEFGLAALRQVVRTLGRELDDWDLVGVGASEDGAVQLSEGRELRLIGKLDAQSYREMLAGSDVGVALMYTPHPSLVPLEMAAAGLLTVTNSCMTKGPDAFSTVTDLIDVAAPDVDSIAASIISAVRRVNSEPIPHYAIDWPVTPQQAFDDAWLDHFIEVARQSLPTGTDKLEP